MAYFAKPSRMLSVLNECPSVDSIEIMNLLVGRCLHGVSLPLTTPSPVTLWPSTRDTIHSLYLRQLTIEMGLHLNTVGSQLRDLEA